MTRIRMAVPALAAAGVLALGGGSAWAYSNGHANPAAPGQAQAVANCENQVDRQLTEGVSPNGGPRRGSPHSTATTSLARAASLRGNPPGEELPGRSAGRDCD